MTTSVLDRVDKFNFAACQIRTFFNDYPISTATGFFYIGGTHDEKPITCLVTNWHVLSGRRSDNPAKPLAKNGALPNRLVTRLVAKVPSPSTPPNGIEFRDVAMDLYEADGQANWYQHPIHKNKVDIDVCMIKALNDEFRIFNIAELFNINNMKISIGMDVSILGYPLNFSHFMNTPVWKRGSIASEPHLETPDAYRRILVDATTRNGMSGSPVIARAYTHYVTEDDRVECAPYASRFIGVYASRPDIQATDAKEASADIRYVYKCGCLHDVIMASTKAPNFNDVP